jgi:histidine ammonia-lyase
MLLRANVIAMGYSGVRMEVLKRLVEMINKRVHPLVPEQGSVGASGDLAPLAHLTSVLMGGR